MAQKLCGVCFKSYANLKQHLNVSHTIHNKEEFSLLLKYGNARTTEPLDCPVCDRRQLVRLDKHLQDFHFINVEERESLLRDAKRQCIKKQFVALRRTDPEIPMLSCLGDPTSDELYDRMPTLEDDMPHNEEPLLYLAMSPGSENCQPEIALPVLSSTPQEPHLSPSGQKTSSAGQICVNTSSPGVPTSSCGVDRTFSEVQASSSSGQTCSAGQTPCSSVNTSSPGVPTSSSGVDRTVYEVQASSSSGQTCSAGQTPCSSVNTSSPGVPTSSSGGQTSPSSELVHSHPLPSSPVTHSSSGQTSPSSELGHSHPLPSSPVTQNQDDSCNTKSPLPNQANCNCNCENVVARLQQLEHTVNRLMRAQPSTPSTPRGIPSKLTASAQKYEHVRKLEKSDHLYQRLIDDFKKFRLGSRTGIKDKENARQAASHVLRFCLYMATGLPSKMVSTDLRFLLQMDKLRTYPVYLSQKGYVPTTVRNMMTNISLFIKHVKCCLQEVSKVKSTELDKIIYELQMLHRNVHKHVVVHRQKVLKKKTDELLDAKKERTFMGVAKTKIPELLKSLPADGSFAKEHCKLMGYLMGYLCILTGHRAIVLVNMTRDQVTSADCWSGGKKYRILVDDHKTMSSFGQAAVCLNKTEFQWVKKVAFGHCCLHGEENKYVFHSVLGRHVLKPTHFLHMAWVDAGLTGSVTFGQIRSSVSTQAKNHLTEKERKEVAHAMCHDPSTAEKYYVALPDKKMAYQTRKLRMKALKEASMKSLQDSNDTSEKSEDTPETSSDDGEVIYDDAPESSSSLSSDEKLRYERRKKRLRGFSEPNSKSSNDDPPEDETPSFPDPSHKSKKKLDFSMQSKKPSVHYVVSPSKSFVLVERMSKSMERYYTMKREAKYRKLVKEIEESLETPLEEAVQKGETMETMDEETPLPPGGGGEDIPETPIEEEMMVEEGGNLEILVEDTVLPPVGQEIPEILVEDMPGGEIVETPVEEAVGTGEILETLVQEGGGEEEIPETPVEDMPGGEIVGTPVEEAVGTGEFLETLVQEGGGEEEIPEILVEDMPETQVINSCPVEDSENPFHPFCFV